MGQLTFDLQIKYFLVKWHLHAINIFLGRAVPAKTRLSSLRLSRTECDLVQRNTVSARWRLRVRCAFQGIVIGLCPAEQTRLGSRRRARESVARRREYGSRAASPCVPRDVRGGAGDATDGATGCFRMSPGDERHGDLSGGERSGERLGLLGKRSRKQTRLPPGRGLPANASFRCARWDATQLLV